MYELLHMFLLVIAICSYLPILPLIKAQSVGFSVELIHRDSPLSPFYNSSITPAEQYRNAVLRSISRINRFRTSSIDEKAFETTAIHGDSGEYLMKLSFGTPPVEVVALADTGSDLIWLQCQPCDHCYEQNSPLFNPANSSSYKVLPCDSESCKALSIHACVKPTNLCGYYYEYFDRTITLGYLSLETIAFGSTKGHFVTFPKSTFGCGIINNGTFSPIASGIVGLGRGPLSLISQLGPRIDYKFSYCLTPIFVNSTSKLSFGKDAIIPRPGIVWTPLASNSEDGTSYSVTLERISIGGQTVHAAVNGSEGNIVVDSGTIVTRLKSSLYSNVEALLKKVINGPPVKDPSGSSFLCYKSGTKVPDITFHFAGADVHLTPSRTFLDSDGLLCFTMLASSESIFGSLAQANFEVGFDLKAKRVSFAPADCAKL